MSHSTSHAEHRSGLTLNLARPIEECPISELHGPGTRLAMWVQGCSIKCTESCINPAALVERERYRVDLDRVITQVEARLEGRVDVEGVTILGGEPTDQPLALTHLLRALRSRGLSVMLYSGHTWSKLQRLIVSQPEIGELLSEVDLLIDGPFIDKLYDPNLLWRGSSNQEIRRLTDRYPLNAVNAAPILRGFDLLLTPEGRLHMSGMHNPEASHALEAILLNVARGARRSVDQR